MNLFYSNNLSVNQAISCFGSVIEQFGTIFAERERERERHGREIKNRAKLLKINLICNSYFAVVPDLRGKLRFLDDFFVSYIFVNHYIIKEVLLLRK
jgi:hypothetical protein